MSIFKYNDNQNLIGVNVKACVVYLNTFNQVNKRT